MSNILSQYFEGTAIKYLCSVEVDPTISNQHELNGVSQLRRMLGDAKQRFQTLFIYLGDNEEDTESVCGSMTWYDSRENHPTRTEYRLYYESNQVMALAENDDLIFIGRRPSGSLIAVVAKKGSAAEKQLQVLYGQTEIGDRNFEVNIELGNRQVGFVEKTILEQMGIEIVDNIDDGLLGELIKRFDKGFPAAKDFSLFARETMPFGFPYDPDYVLLRWLEREETLFKFLEEHLAGEQVAEGFQSVDEFIKLASSIMNRRKSRAGASLENHLEQIFIDHGLHFTYQGITEGKSKPDFVFPDIMLYHRLDNQKVNEIVTVLGAKRTCKDRWRQVLAEAKKIDRKYILTIEQGISVNQTNEMKENQLQLIVPEAIQNTYHDSQIDWLINLAEFIEELDKRQILWEKEGEVYFK